MSLYPFETLLHPATPIQTPVKPMNAKLMITIFRNHIPWAILSACWFVSMVLILILRWYLARQNSKRDNETHDSTYDDVYIENEGEKAVKVDKVRLSPYDFRIPGNLKIIPPISCTGLFGSHRSPKSRFPICSLIPFLKTQQKPPLRCPPSPISCRRSVSETVRTINACQCYD